jgi:hypothetical protein
VSTSAYDVDAAFMSIKVHGRGIHALRAGGRSSTTSHIYIAPAPQNQENPGSRVPYGDDQPKPHGSEMKT